MIACEHGGSGIYVHGIEVVGEVVQKMVPRSQIVLQGFDTVMAYYPERACAAGVK